jgi:hypothetical protein
MGFILLSLMEYVLVAGALSIGKDVSNFTIE